MPVSVSPLSGLVTKHDTHGHLLGQDMVAWSCLWAVWMCDIWSNITMELASGHPPNQFASSY